MATNYTIKHRDEFERMEGSGESTWLLARKACGTTAFGYNLVEIGPGGQIPEHDESGSGQVELYVILEGEAVMLLDGEEHPAPAGTFASIEPAATRTILNRSGGTVVAMLIGVEPDGGYEPMSWA
jgi:uncharacterized cupin superfamily protein